MLAMVSPEVQVEKPYISISADGKCSADTAKRGDSLSYTVWDTSPESAKGSSCNKKFGGSSQLGIAII